jgi:hypothetical protein
VSLDPVHYGPVSANVPLPSAPRLESWDAAGSASQSALTAYLRELEQLAAPLVASTDGALAFALDIALPPGTDLLDQRDLDNYLLPALRHLTKAYARPFVAINGTKQHGSTSFFGIGPAKPPPLPVLATDTGCGLRHPPRQSPSSSRSPMRSGAHGRSRQAPWPSTSFSVSARRGRGSTSGADDRCPRGPARR